MTDRPAEPAQTGNQPLADHHKGETVAQDTAAHYWRQNLRLLSALLIIGFIVSFGFGILAVDWLNQFSLFGFKLGFWWAQQGAIFVFVILIFIYNARMKRIERNHGVDDDA